jgi:cytochrome c-type biogenesis protein CcmF
MISEAFWDEKVTVGPPYYNAWVQPIALTIFSLMGIGTLFGWKKTSEDGLKKAFRVPLGVMGLVVLLQFAFGRRLGFPAIVWSDAIYGGWLGQMLRAFNAITPVLGFSLAAFNATILVREFVLLFRSRRKSGADKDTPAALWYAGIFPGFLYTLVTLPAPSRRRYGGYIVHFGIVLAFIGFTGRSWTVDKETSLSPGQKYEVGAYTLEYQGPRMEVDNSKRMVFADLRVTKGGEFVGTLHPAKFIYKKSPESPTTEVSIHRSLREDLYVIVGVINPTTKVATLQVHINPLVTWIWIGCLVLIFGSVVCMWPQLAPQEVRAWQFSRGAAAAATAATLGLLVVMWPSSALARPPPAGMDDMHGTVRIDNDLERSLFSSLKCQCGCPDDLLSTCSCAEAEAARNRLRERLALGATKDQLLEEYRQAYGTAALSVPPNSGALRAIYAVPLVAIFGGAVGLGVTVARWRHRHRPDEAPTSTQSPSTVAKDEYDARLDEELKDLDG